jgi:hypothetical protein
MKEMRVAPFLSPSFPDFVDPVEDYLFRIMHSVSQRSGGVVMYSIAEAAKRHGLNATMGFEASWDPKAGLHQQAQMRAAAVVGIPVQGHQAHTVWNDNTIRQILAVVVRGPAGERLSYHCLLRRPDGTIMDPMTGQDFENLDHLNAVNAAKRIRYSPLGSSINVSTR